MDQLQGLSRSKLGVDRAMRVRARSSELFVNESIGSISVTIFEQKKLDRGVRCMCCFGSNHVIKITQNTFVSNSTGRPLILLLRLRTTLLTKSKPSAVSNMNTRDD